MPSFFVSFDKSLQRNGNLEYLLSAKHFACVSVLSLTLALQESYYEFWLTSKETETKPGKVTRVWPYE